MSIYEIYMERIRDLLDGEGRELRVREETSKGVYVEGLSQFIVESFEEAAELVGIAKSNRRVAGTAMNDNSSRSHLVYRLEVAAGNATGRLTLVDLAGSEKVSKSGAVGRTFEEMKKINLSLSALGNVINSLTDGVSSHVPYRSSTLTRILQESLGGNSKTSLIVTISPSISNVYDTISTLRFGQRAKKIKNAPRINREITMEGLTRKVQARDEEIKRLVKRVDHLQSLLDDNKERIGLCQRGEERLEGFVRDSRCEECEMYKERYMRAMEDVSGLRLERDMMRIDVEESERERELISRYIEDSRKEMNKEREMLLNQVVWMFIEIRDKDETIERLEREKKQEDLGVCFDIEYIVLMVIVQ